MLTAILLVVGGDAISAAEPPAPGARAPRIGGVFRDCASCPEMIVVPAGTFRIGSPADEPGRGEDEGPQRVVVINAPFAVGRFEVTRDQYEAFLHATGHPIGGNCITDRRRSGQWEPDAATDLRDPGYPQSGNHPVVCVSRDDAKAYLSWLNSVTGAGYRLLSEAEWEYLARAGTRTAYPWGAKASEGCAHMNGTDLTTRAKYAFLSYMGDFGACDDGALNTAPVGSYRPNAFGIHDMIGNVAEWVEDCSSTSYATMTPSGAPRTGACTRYVVRGGSWGTIARQLRAAERLHYAATDRDDSIGIRVALDLPRASAAPRP